jgi:hypothetical protein
MNQITAVGILDLVRTTQPDTDAYVIARTAHTRGLPAAGLELS